MPLVLLLGVSLQIRLTKARPSFYMMSKAADSKTNFKFLEAQLFFKRIKPDPIKLTKARPSFYMMSKAADSKTIFKFLDAQLLVKRIKPDPILLLAHISTLDTGVLERYNTTKIEFKSLIFFAG